MVHKFIKSIYCCKVLPDYKYCVRFFSIYYLICRHKSYENTKDNFSLLIKMKEKNELRRNSVLIDVIRRER